MKQINFIIAFALGGLVFMIQTDEKKRKVFQCWGDRLAADIFRDACEIRLCAE